MQDARYRIQAKAKKDFTGIWYLASGVCKVYHIYNNKTTACRAPSHEPRAPFESPAEQALNLATRLLTRTLET